MQISEELPSGTGFMLFLFDYVGRDGRIAYVSTAERSGCIKVMKEFIERLQREVH